MSLDVFGLCLFSCSAFWEANLARRSSRRVRAVCKVAVRNFGPCRVTREPSISKSWRGVRSRRCQTGLSSQHMLSPPCKGNCCPPGTLHSPGLLSRWPGFAPMPALLCSQAGRRAIPGDPSASPCNWCCDTDYGCSCRPARTDAVETVRPSTGSVTMP